LDKVSILMNGYNAQRYLKDAIDSIYAQTFTDWEIVFIDNCSTDNTKNIVESYDNTIKYYKTEETIPLGVARNFGLKYCKGKYIAFLDTDDIWLPDKLQLQVQLMESNDRYALCYGSSITIDEHGNKIRDRRVENTSGFIFGELLKQYEINMQSVMLRAEILKSSGLHFDESLQYCPDYQLFMEIASRYSIGVIADNLVKYRMSSNSLSRKTIHIAPSETAYVLDKIIGHYPDIKRKYHDEFKQAYAKTIYYSAISSMYKFNRRQAISSMMNIIFIRYEYFLIFFLLLLPVRIKFILKLLGRQ
jgi:glycosyltransferase involved in cell wall biosynthesis